jgi:glycosyltransferase involved in cell wall biosynthesis
MNNILCSISTKNRYYTTLPTVLYSVINQTLKPDKIILFDDNDQPEDLRANEIYGSLFQIMDRKGIEWGVVFGEKKGQHYNHQKANTMGYNWVWRCDDDVFPESNVLENLYKHTAEGVGAIAGEIIVPYWDFPENIPTSNKITELELPNKQWFKINNVEEVDHLHCSFLYRAGINDFNLNLSKVAHREETLFTYQLKQKGYKNLIVPDATSYHLKSNTGGIRDDIEELFIHDEKIFQQLIGFGDKKLIVLNGGIGDHIVFKSILPEILEKYKDIVIGCCYPDIFEDYPDIRLISIEQANKLINTEELNIYKWMIDNKWTKSLQNAYRGLYLK